MKQTNKKILTRIGITCLERNFGGLENSSKKIIEIFKDEYGLRYHNENFYENNLSVLDIIKINKVIFSYLFNRYCYIINLFSSSPIVVNNKNLYCHESLYFL